MSLSFSLAKVSEIIPLRHQVLRTGKPIESCNFNGDLDETTLHFSAKLDDEVVGCVSFMKNKHPEFEHEFPYQLRGMAVSPKYRGIKIGAQLLSYAEAHLKSIGESFIWCNVRQVAIPFYRKQGYASVGNRFEIKDIGPHVVMYKKL